MKLSQLSVWTALVAYVMAIPQERLRKVHAAGDLQTPMTTEPDIHPSDQHFTQPPVPIDEAFEWTNATSTKGNPYHIGWRRTAQHPTSKPDCGTPHPTRDDFDETMYWTVNGKSEPDWTELLIDFKGKTGIHRYKLWESNGWVYSYTLKIDSDCCVTYQFCDASEDCYTLSSVVRGEHKLKYNSEKPVMRRVHN